MLLLATAILIPLCLIALNILINSISGFKSLKKVIEFNCLFFQIKSYLYSGSPRLLVKICSF